MASMLLAMCFQNFSALFVSVTMCFSIGPFWGVYLIMTINSLNSQWAPDLSDTNLLDPADCTLPVELLCA